MEQLVREVHSARTSSDGETGENTEKNCGEEESLAAEQDPQSHSDQRPRKQNDWRPKRLVRTCLSSMLPSNEFGAVVAGEAQQRGFYDATAQAFLGDGSACNWTIHRTYFSGFVPIADFVHPLGYIYDAAKAISSNDPWPQYLKAATACWQGRVADVIRELRQWQTDHPFATR